MDAGDFASLGVGSCILLACYLETGGRSTRLFMALELPSNCIVTSFDRRT